MAMVSLSRFSPVIRVCECVCLLDLSFTWAASWVSLILSFRSVCVCVGLWWVLWLSTECKTHLSLSLILTWVLEHFFPFARAESREWEKCEWRGRKNRKNVKDRQSKRVIERQAYYASLIYTSTVFNWVILSRQYNWIKWVYAHSDKRMATFASAKGEKGPFIEGAA